MRCTPRLFNRLWQTAVFDTETGRGRWFSRLAPTSDGYAYHRWGRGWFAIYRPGPKPDLVFQAGKRRFEMDGQLEFRNQRQGLRRRFTVSSDGAEVYRLEYRILPRELLDPTFDALDLEISDFFAYVTMWGNESLGRVANRAQGPLFWLCSRGANTFRLGERNARAE
jgi:hypothetical protein